MADRIYNASGAMVRASGSVSPEQAKALKPGQPLAIRVSDRETVSGRIAALSEQMAKVTGTVEVLVDISKSAELAVGSFLAAKATIESGENVATVPRSALIQATEGYSVDTVSGEHFVRTPVKVGTLNADMAEIREGLYSARRHCD